MDILLETAKHTVVITTFVFVMMVWVDYFNVITQGRLSLIVKGNQRRQYFISSFLGALPGCLGSFMAVSFYAHGLLSFGAIVANMIATSGDEAFVMFALFPKQALLLTAILFLVGMAAGWLVDRFGAVFQFKKFEECRSLQVHDEEDCRCFNIPQIIKGLKHLSLARFSLILILGFLEYAFLTGLIGPSEWNWKRFAFIFLASSVLFIVLTVPEHYLEEHIWNHIAKRHLWRVGAWTFAALGLVSIGLAHWNVEMFVQNHMVWVFFVACLVGLIPESGPHMIFVILYAKGMVPFSVLLASSIVQDGHGALPLLSYSWRDAVAIKLISLFFGVVIGGALFVLGW